MRSREIKREQLERMIDLLERAERYVGKNEIEDGEGARRACAEYLCRHGAEPREQAKWIKDETYTGNNKDIYACSRCLHWQSVKKMQKEQIMFMKYCPFCGARMTVEPKELVRSKCEKGEQA